METIIPIIWFLGAFAWSVTDVKKRINKNGIKWYYIFTFMFNMAFMPVLAFLEKKYTAKDYTNAIRKIIS